MKMGFRYRKWLAEYLPDDGGRLSRLCYDDVDLLTTEPATFQPPSEDYGAYETRPVYGYDDCFPSVEPSLMPGSQVEIPDHGELCWLEWRGSAENDRLNFQVDSRLFPVRFTRSIQFKERELVWDFNIHHYGGKTIPFQHVIHPLLPLSRITSISLPRFRSVMDDEGAPIPIEDPSALEEHLLQVPTGEKRMLFLQELETSEVGWTMESGLAVTMRFPLNHFPTLGIWWNNLAYPDEDGRRRDECAFEPVPGTSSHLGIILIDRTCLVLEPGETFSWQMSWEVDGERIRNADVTWPEKR